MQFTKSSLGTTLLGFSSIGFALPLYLLLLSGFPTVDGFKVCSMIFVQIVSGSIIWAHVMHPRQVDIVEGVGMGLALGSILTVIGHQLLLPTALSKFGWLLPVVVAAIVFATSQSTKGSFKNFVLEDVSGLFFVAFAIVLILKQWWWLLPLSLPTGLALYLLSNSGKNKLRNFVRPAWLIIATIFVAATLLMVYLRQLNLDWWIRSWDVTYFESKSYSIAKFGPSENISLLGYPMNYHWLGIAWIGTVSVVNNLSSWLSIAQVAPVYSMVSISCLIWAIGRRVGKNLYHPFALIFIFVFGTPTLSPANPPNIIAMIWAISALLIAYDFFASGNSKLLVPFAVLSIAALAGKVSAGFVILGAFTITDIYRTFSQQKSLIQCAMRNIVLAAISLAAFYLIIGGPNRLGNNTFKLSYKGPGLFFGVDSERNPLIFMLGTFGVSTGLFQILIISLVALKWQIGDKNILIFCIAAFAAGYLPFLIATDEGMAYFISNALNFAGVGAAVALIGIVQFLDKEKLISKLQILSAALIGLVLAKIWISIYEFNWREIIDFRGGPTPILVAILLCSVTSYWLATYVVLLHPPIGSKQLLVKTRVMIFSIVLLSANVLPKFFDHLINIPSKSHSQVQVPYVGSRNIQDASSWVQSNVPQTSVFATNKFCLEDRARLCIDPKFFGVSSTTKHRVLVEGPYYVVGGLYFTNQNDVTDRSQTPLWVKERLDLSRGFADKPKLEIAARLRELGVDWFYLFLDNTENRNWQPYATVEYQNSEVAILKLADPNP